MGATYRKTIRIWEIQTRGGVEFLTFAVIVLLPLKTDLSLVPTSAIFTSLWNFRGGGQTASYLLSFKNLIFPTVLLIVTFPLQ